MEEMGPKREFQFRPFLRLLLGILLLFILGHAAYPAVALDTGPHEELLFVVRLPQLNFALTALAKFLHYNSPCK